MATIIKGGQVVLENDVKALDIAVEGERILALGENLPVKDADTVIDAAGRIVMPGIIDSHVHFNMKTASGGHNADDFVTGSACAAVSGVTTVVDFADPQENMTLPEALHARAKEANGNCYTDYSFHMEITNEYPIDFDEIALLPAEGIRALKIYTTYGKTELPAERLPAFFEAAAKANMITLVHAEDNAIILATRELFKATGRTQAKYHGESRPIAAEVSAIRSILPLAEKAGAQIIIAHISSGEGANLVAKARAAGQKVYGETCPHYLLLTDDCYQMEKPQRFIMTPPLRKSADNEQLWGRVISGDIDKISTDHCPFKLSDKIAIDSCFDSIPGIGGTETLLPLMFYEGYLKGRLSLLDLSNRLSLAAAKLYGLYPQKGVIAVGSDADLVIIDPDEEYTITADRYPSRAGYTVYEGRRVKGLPKLTMLRGEIIARGGKIVAGCKQGRFVKAQ